MNELVELQGLRAYLSELWMAVIVLAIVVPPLFALWRRNRWQIQIKYALVLSALAGPFCLLISRDLRNIDLAIRLARDQAPIFAIPTLIGFALSVYVSGRLFPRANCALTHADEDIVNRRPVWQSLSLLFLDTELSDDDFSEIAHTLARSPYTLAEIESILFREVYPVCIPNMRCVAGEWDGFDHDWLESMILQYWNRSIAPGRVLHPNRWMIQDAWNCVKGLYAKHDENQQLRQEPDVSTQECLYAEERGRSS